MTLPRYRFTGIIPARYASSRFPGKPLVMISGKPMIQRVYEQASRVLGKVFVATDDSRIYDAVLNFGGKALITSPLHRSGTDRCAEAVDVIFSSGKSDMDVIINVQGDEPFIKPEQISLLMSCFSDSSVEIATLVRKVKQQEDIVNPNHPKVVIGLNGDAIYFSRSVIPYIRDSEIDKWTSEHIYFKHVGLYAYTTGVLKKIAVLPQSPLEKAESLEQNRWLENGFKIRTAVTEWESHCIDTPEDLEKLNVRLD